MSKNILLFHIGVPKTGSTALQDFLLLNREKLNEVGWSYPKIGYYYGNINGDSLLRSLYKKDEREFNEKMNLIVEHLQKYNVIISCEYFFPQPALKLFSRVKKFWDNIKAIIYLRRQDLYIESLYNQKIKMVIPETRSIEDCTESIINNPKLKFLEYLNKYEQALGGGY